MIQKLVLLLISIHDREHSYYEKKLFKNVDCKNDPQWVVKEFFNSIYQRDNFLWVLPLIVENKGCGVNEDYCFFPDMNDPDPFYHVTGVTFGTMDNEVTISDDQCNTYLMEACDRYLEDNPEDRDLVINALGANRRRD